MEVALSLKSVYLCVDLHEMEPCAIRIGALDFRSV